MSETANRYREVVIAQVLTGPGQVGQPQRRAAFDHTTSPDQPTARLLDKVTRTAWKVTDEDVAELKAASIPEDHIFELAVCAAVGQASRQLASALAALATARAALGTKP